MLTRALTIAAFIIGILLMPASTPGDVTLPLCSPARHDKYKAIGPDGVSYPTWHPVVDAEAGCHFDHEHGSDPRAFGVAPLYGYSAAAMGMSEGHAGFKSYVFTRSGYTWLMTQHQGTANAALAACVRYHTLDIAARDSAGVLVADLHLMADFGRSVSNHSNLPFTPPSCPNQGSIGASTGIRQLPAVDDENIGYEPWRVDNEVPLPFWSSGAITFNTTNPQTACNTITCTASVRRTDIGGAVGAYRLVTINGGFRLHATTIYSNTFTWQGAQQYIAPGVDIALAESVCRPVNFNAYLYTCTAYPDEMEFIINPLLTGAN